MVLGFSSPIQTIIGSILLHLSTSSLLSLTGRPLGISGIFDGFLFSSPGFKSTKEKKDEWITKFSLVGGLIVGPLVLWGLGLSEVGKDVGGVVGGLGGKKEFWEGMGWGRLGVAGVLVGFGSRVSHLFIFG